MAVLLIMCCLLFRWLSQKAFSPISCNVIKNSCSISLSIYNRNVYHFLLCLSAYQSLRSLFLSVLLESNWHTVLPKFKVYSIMTWLPCIMKGYLSRFRKYPPSHLDITFIFAAPCSVWDSWFPDQGSNPCPLQWKHGVWAVDCQGNP